MKVMFTLLKMAKDCQACKTRLKILSAESRWALNQIQENHNLQLHQMRAHCDLVKTRLASSATLSDIREVNQFAEHLLPDDAPGRELDYSEYRDCLRVELEARADQTRCNLELCDSCPSEQ